MTCRITIAAGEVSIDAELDDSPTALAIRDVLPIRGRAQLWGEEIYFEIPVDLGPAPDARADVAVGELGYWPPGRALCVFFGPTPASGDDQPRAASPVNIVGRVDGDATAFRAVTAGTNVVVKRAAR
jgi:hypothetical protein